jgi:hypothetical protein
MMLSVIMTSPNAGSRAVSHVLELCSTGCEDVEIIIRDTSGSDEKRIILEQVQQKNCKIIFASPCSAQENLGILLKEAAGEFVLLADDSYFTNSYAISSILAEILRIRDTSEIIGTTGLFAIDEAKQTSFAGFKNLDTQAPPAARLKVFLADQIGSIQFSPIRREVAKNVHAFRSTLPISLPTHQALVNGLYLTHGRITYVKRYFCRYSVVAPDAGLQIAMQYFRDAGLDGSGVHLLGLITAFEGAQSLAQKYQRDDFSGKQRNECATTWLLHWLANFIIGPISATTDNTFDAHAITVADKWRRAKTFSPETVLADIVGHFNLSSPKTAQAYYDFWH